MSEFNEKRAEIRMNVSCEIHCQPKNSAELYKAWCVTLSGSGISFFTKHEFKIGEEIEVYIEPENEIMKTMSFFINIVRSTPQNNGLFEVGASIRHKED